MTTHDPTDSLDRLGAAMARSKGELDLYARFGAKGFTVLMATDDGEVARGVGDTLPDAVATARTNLGAAVREAVAS